MRTKDLLGPAIVAAAIVVGFSTPAIAEGVGKIEAIIEQYLIRKTILSSSGTYSAPTFTGGTLSSQVNGGVGAGAITHLLGPSDQTFLVSAGTARDLRLNVDVSRAMHFSVAASNVLSLVSTTAKVAISN